MKFGEFDILVTNLQERFSQCDILHVDLESDSIQRESFGIHETSAVFDTGLVR